MSAPVPEGEVHALLNIDLRNAFNEANRNAGFDAIIGKSSRAYDDGRVQIGDQLPHLVSMHMFFLYFQAMHQCPSTLRYTDHKGTVHHIEGTTGGKQGDTLDAAFLFENPPYLGQSHGAQPAGPCSGLR